MCLLLLETGCPRRLVRDDSDGLVLVAEKRVAQAGEKAIRVEQ
jgi:hypothetical protein